MKNTNDLALAVMALLAILSAATLALFQWDIYNDEPYPMVIDVRQEQIPLSDKTQEEKPKEENASQNSYTSPIDIDVQQEQIPLPDKTQEEKSEEKEILQPAYNFSMDINKADSQALMQVKGIGEKRAGQIIAYRTEHGGIKDMRELLEIKGIGEVTLQRLEEKFYVQR